MNEQQGTRVLRLAIAACATALLVLALPAFASADFSLTVQAEGSGTGSWECEVEEGPVQPCEAEYPAGTELVVLAEADPGSEFLEFHGDCGPLVCYLTMDEDHIATAVFEAEEAEAFALNIEEPGGGSGTVQCEANGGPLEGCEAEYPEGTELSLIAEADPGSEFLEWGGECDSIAGNECELEMDEEKNVEAIFELEPPEFALNIEEPGSGEGTVECIVEGGPLEGCEAEYPEGTELSLIAEADPGSEFLEWGGECDLTAGSECELEMREERTVEAIFEAKPTVSLAIDVAGSGSGTVECKVNGGPAEACEAEYPEGAELALVALAKAGSTFASYSAGTGSATGCSTSPCAFTIEADSEVTATFNPIAKPEFKLKVKKTGTGTGRVESTSPVSPKISCGTECEKEFEEGKVVTLAQTAEPGSKFVEWNGACTGTGSCEVTMSAAREVTAKFDLIPTPKFKLTVSKPGTGTGTVTSTPAGISCGATCSAEFEEGKEVELAQVAAAGSEFVKWSGACTGTGACKVTISSAREVSAEFKLAAKPKFKLTVSKSGTGTGTVTSTPAGISCGATCSAEFEEGKVVELKAEAAPGSEFKEWSGACTGAGACKVAISSAKSVGARFDLIPKPKFKLAVTEAGTGTGTVTSTPAGISCGATCSAEFEEGKEVELAQVAAAGSEFVKWSGACTGTGACKVTISSAKSVTATFKLLPVAKFKLKVTKAGTGAGKVTCNGVTCASAYFQGAEVTLAATAASGSTFAGFSGAGCSGTGACKVTIEADTAVTATFDISPTPPPPASCVVPRLAGKTLARAKGVLRAAHCALGKATKPKAKRGKKPGPLVVKSSSPAPGTTLPNGSKVNLKLGPKPRKKKRR